MDWGLRTGLCTMWYMEWLANRHLLYSKELYPVFHDNLCRKKIRDNGYVYMYNWVTLYSRNYHSLVN